MSEHRNGSSDDSGDDSPSIDQLLKAANWDERLEAARAKRARVLGQRRGADPEDVSGRSDTPRLFGPAKPRPVAPRREGAAVPEPPKPPATPVAQAGIRPAVPRERASPVAPAREATAASSHPVRWLVSGIVLGLAGAIGMMLQGQDLLVYLGDIGRGAISAWQSEDLENNPSASPPPVPAGQVEPEIQSGTQDRRPPSQHPDGDETAASVPAGLALDQTDPPVAASAPGTDTAPRTGTASSTSVAASETFVPQLDTATVLDDIAPTMGRQMRLSGPIDPARYSLEVHGRGAGVSKNLDSLREIGFALPAAEAETFPVRRDEIRYFHPSDADAARAIAAVLGVEPRNFASFRPRPDVGTIEIWLAEKPSGPQE